MKELWKVVRIIVLSYVVWAGLVVLSFVVLALYSSNDIMTLVLVPIIGFLVYTMWQESGLELTSKD